MARRRGITDWFPTKGEARGLVEIKGRVGGSGGRSMRGRRRTVNSVKVRTTWIPWMAASDYRGAYSVESLPFDHSSTAAIVWNPWAPDIDVNRRTMMANQSKILRWQGAIWCMPRQWSSTEDPQDTNESSDFLVMWYWHKAKLEPTSGSLEEVNGDWAMNSDDGSGYPQEGDSLMMRKDINKWGQGWTRRVISNYPMAVNRIEYTVPASVAGDQQSYDVPAIESQLATPNCQAFCNIYPYRIPGPKLPLTLEQGEALVLRVTAQLPPNRITNLLPSDNPNGNAPRPVVFPNGRWLVTT